MYGLSLRLDQALGIELSDCCCSFHLNFIRHCLQFIVVFVVKVLKMKEVNDVREYEDEDRNNAAAGLLTGSQENNDDDAGHHIAAQR